MKLWVMRHLWGVTESWDEVFPKLQESGYVGIEAGLPAPEERERFQRLLERYGFEYIPQIFTQGNTLEEHLESFGQAMATAALFNPKFINCHSGRDAWSEAESIKFFEQALNIEAQAQLPVAHETHRGRILYNPWITSRLLTQFADLKLCCDFSHWVCVCERIIDDQLDILRQCSQHCLHIHARIGYGEGPQVPDPRAPEYQAEVEAHERWWELMWEGQAARGFEVTTLTPEFGPPSYLHTLPYTNVPVADLWEICNWQANRQAANFARWVTDGGR
jgi:sugar phosphate isomerase/epimerase